MKLAAVFCDNAVFQANKPIRVFGEGKGKGSIEFDGKEYFVKSDGYFEIELDPHGYGGPYELKYSFGKNVGVIKNIFVGEVLLLAGQSNLQFTIGESEYEKSHVEIADNRLIRAYTTKRLEKNQELQEEDGWVECTKENLLKWSAIGYHLAGRISRERNCAVGIACAYQGASIIHTWLPRKVTLSDELRVDEQKLYTELYPLYLNWNLPGTLYEYQFKKISRYNFGDVIWYQGETDAESVTNSSYGKLLKALVETWRSDMCDDVHFTIVQIHNLGEKPTKMWKTVQKQQLAAEKHIKNVTVVKSADLSETDNIHPVNKLPLADRIFDLVFKK